MTGRLCHTDHVCISESGTEWWWDVIADRHKHGCLCGRQSSEGLCCAQWEHLRPAKSARLSDSLNLGSQFLVWCVTVKGTVKGTYTLVPADHSTL